MRISDWSPDFGASDLAARGGYTEGLGSLSARHGRDPCRCDQQGYVGIHPELMGKSGTDRAVRPGSIAAIRLSVGAAYPLPDCWPTISRYRPQQTCDRKGTRRNPSHTYTSRMHTSAHKKQIRHSEPVYDYF